jgi:hypothetical protein
MNSQILNSSHPLWNQLLKELRHDFYHLSEYLDLEASRSKATPEAFVFLEGEKIFFVPYLLRQISEIFPAEGLPAGICDLVSPYGYPGILMNDAATQTPAFLHQALQHFQNVLQERQVCSAFFRLHPILNADLEAVLPVSSCQVSGETVSIDLSLSETEIWNHTKPAHRNKINRGKRAGLTASIVNPKDYINQFLEIYQETMDYVGASNFYYFDQTYFLQLIERLDKRLYLCIVELDKQIISAGLYTECCQIVQAHLGGTKREFLKLSPTNLETDHVRFWAKERGNIVLHLGGGVGSSKDSLYTFKAGFSRLRHSFLTLRLIINPNLYDELTCLRAEILNTEAKTLTQSGFFPAYRFKPE